MVIFKIRIFKLSDINQGIYKHAIENKLEFEKNYPEKRKKILILCIQDYTLCSKKNLHAKFFLKSVCLSKKFDLQLKKNWGNFNFTFKNFCCRHQKNASHTLFIYGNCMITVFSQKNKHRFFITRLFYLVQIAAETSLNLFFSLIFLKLYDKHFRSMEL